MKKTLKVVLLSVLSFTLMFAAVACGKATEPADQSASVSETVSESATVSAEATESAQVSEAVSGEKVVIGFAQSRMNHPYRVAAVEQFQAAVKAAGYNWEVIVSDGQNDTAKQMADVEDLIVRGVDVIVMSPINAEALAPVAKEVMDAGIPLVLLDRTISTDDYTVFIGGDNKMIGELVAEQIATAANGKEVKVVQLQGTLGASATIDRDAGFKETIAKYPNIKIVQDLSAEYDRAAALDTMEDILQVEQDIFAVYCHNDAMAMGAMTAIQADDVKGVLIYGADGTKEVFDEIKKGTIAGTCLYPTGSEKAVEVIAQMLAGDKIERSYSVEVPYVNIDNVEEMYDQGI